MHQDEGAFKLSPHPSYGVVHVVDQVNPLDGPWFA